MSKYEIVSNTVDIESHQSIPDDNLIQRRKLYIRKVINRVFLLLLPMFNLFYCLYKVVVTTPNPHLMTVFMVSGFMTLSIVLLIVLYATTTVSDFSDTEKHIGCIPIFVVILIIGSLFKINAVLIVALMLINFMFALCIILLKIIHNILGTKKVKRGVWERINVQATLEALAINSIILGLFSYVLILVILVISYLCRK